MTGPYVEVTGVPNTLSDDQMKDKLMIHFLRPRNGGGEVTRVIFPSYRSGQAFVIFEEAAVVDRILTRNHVLEFDNHAFPLQVKEAGGAEVDLPAEANLNMRLFGSDQDVLRVLRARGLRVTQLQDEARVQGSFQRLREANAELQLLLKQPPLPHPSFNGHGQPLGAVAKSTRRGHDVSYSPTVFDSTAAVNGHRSAFSPPLRSSPSSDFLHGQSSPPGHGASFSPTNPPSSRPHTSFMTDSDLLQFAQCFNKKDIDLILQRHKVRMSVEEMQEADVTNVVLQGRDPQAAMEELQAVLKTLTKTIRTQEIHLHSADHNSQANIDKRIQKFKDVFDSVLIYQVGDTIRLVGPSRDSYELKQRILGEPVDLPPAARRGRPQSRGLIRRSSSLPRQLHKIDSPSHEQDVHPAAPGQRSSKDEGGSARGVLQAGGVNVAPKRNPRQRSSSDSRVQKPMMQAQWHDDAEAVTSREPTSPRVKKSLLQKLSSKKQIKKVFTRGKKKEKKP